MKLSRKNFLQTGALAAVGTALGLPAEAAAAPDRKRTLRIAHLTDIHLQPGKVSETGFENALQQVHELSDKPDVIFFGGDNIMDALAASKEKTKEQFILWQAKLGKLCRLSYHTIIGNHDVYGWSQPGFAKKTGLDSKKRACDELNIKNRFYSIELGGWKCLMLDSTQPQKSKGYIAAIDPEQMEWLKGELKSTAWNTPIALISHIPIFCMSALFDGSPFKDNAYRVSGSNIHSDARALKDLLYQHKNVKLALSGHIHLIDRVDYLNVKYLCNGAVSGAWWGGINQEFPPAFATINLYDDGSSEHEMHYYKWQ